MQKSTYITLIAIIILGILSFFLINFLESKKVTDWDVIGTPEYICKEDTCTAIITYIHKITDEKVEREVTYNVNEGLQIPLSPQ